MFEHYQNTLCVQGGWLYDPAGAAVIKKYEYDNYVRRGPFRVLRNGRGKNNPSLVAWVSLPQEIQLEIVREYGDPTKTAKHILFRDYLENDPKAVQFYADYTLPTGEAIAEPSQKRYVAEAAILNAINRVLNDRVLKTKALGSGGLTKSWEKLGDIVADLPRHTWPHSLPKNHRSLQRKYKAYQEEGYASLIHKGHGHKNSEKINDSAKMWVLGRWSDRVKKVATLAQLLDEYNAMAAERDWKPLKEEKTLYNYLNHPEVKNLWYGYRYGELNAREKYAYQHKTKLPSMRDSLWYGDGTKLNLYYLDDNGKMATCQVYEVIDAFSEVLLGYHVSKTEDYVAQYHAYKMAVKNSGHRPYEVRFDNQGGHKKLTTGHFMGKLAKLAIRTKPYNGKSKTIESAFGRFQQQVMKKLWYFTGQNVTAKKLESKANMEFILANAKALPTLEEAIADYEACRKEWNQAPHYKTKEPRLDMYHNSTNPDAPEIGLFEMVDIFWVQRKEAVTCTASGIKFREKKKEYHYMVYGEDRLPDVDWIANNVDRKFIVKFDPEDMSLVYLYEDTPMGLRRVTAAETKLEVHRGKQEQENWEAGYFQAVAAKEKENRIRRRDQMDGILEDLGMLPEQYGLTSPHLKGIESKKKSAKMDIGQWQKKESNKVMAEVEETDADYWDEY